MRLTFNEAKKQLQYMSTLSRIPQLKDIEKFFNNFRMKYNLTESQAFVHKTSIRGLPALRFVLKYQNNKYSYVVPFQIEDYVNLTDKFRFIDEDDSKYYIKKRKINDKLKYYLSVYDNDKLKIKKQLDIEEVNHLVNNNRLKYYLD